MERKGFYGQHRMLLQRLRKAYNGEIGQAVVAAVQWRHPRYDDGHSNMVSVIEILFTSHNKNVHLNRKLIGDGEHMTFGGYVCRGIC